MKIKKGDAIELSWQIGLNRERERESGKLVFLAREEMNFNFGRLTKFVFARFARDSGY